MSAHPSPVSPSISSRQIHLLSISCCHIYFLSAHLYSVDTPISCRPTHILLTYSSRVGTSSLHFISTQKSLISWRHIHHLSTHTSPVSTSLFCRDLLSATHLLSSYPAYKSSVGKHTSCRQIHHRIYIYNESFYILSAHLFTDFVAQSIEMWTSNPQVPELESRPLTLNCFMICLLRNMLWGFLGVAYRIFLPLLTSVTLMRWQYFLLGACLVSV